MSDQPWTSDETSFVDPAPTNEIPAVTGELPAVSPDERGTVEESRPRLSAVVDGDEVRELVEREEREMTRLLRELTAALRAAEGVERRLVAHPAASRLDELPASLAVNPAAPLVGVSPSLRAEARTVVDRRSRPTAQGSAGPVAPGTGRRLLRRGGRAGRRRSQPVETATAAATEPRRRRGAHAQSRRTFLRTVLVTGWVWKVGLAVVVAALVLLKMG